MIRILHLSDLHVLVPASELPLREMFNKRLVGAANLLLRRRRRFIDAERKLQLLAEFAQEQAVDLVLCTGDYTILGTEPELRAARLAIEGLTRRPMGFVTVPGNHDLYLPDTLADGRFERCFGDLLGNDWPEVAVDGGFPAVRLFGEDLAVVAVNSARPNPQVWRSSGRISEVQLSALRQLFADPRLAERFVFVITHYAPRRADGTPDAFSHGLENADELLEACATLRRGALLHGHIHRRFHVQVPQLSAGLFGAGSATDLGREGLWLFELEGTGGRAIPGGYADGAYVLEPQASVPV